MRTWARCPHGGTRRTQYLFGEGVKDIVASPGRGNAERRKGDDLVCGSAGVGNENGRVHSGSSCGRVG